MKVETRVAKRVEQTDLTAALMVVRWVVLKAASKAATSVVEKVA